MGAVTQHSPVPAYLLRSRSEPEPLWTPANGASVGMPYWLAGYEDPDLMMSVMGEPEQMCRAPMLPREPTPTPQPREAQPEPRPPPPGVDPAEWAAQQEDLAEQADLDLDRQEDIDAATADDDALNRAAAGEEEPAAEGGGAAEGPGTEGGPAAQDVAATEEAASEEDACEDVPPPGESAPETGEPEDKAGAPGEVGAGASAVDAPVPRPRPARLGGTDAVLIGEPPPMQPKALLQLKRATGISADEHHDRVRGALNRLAARARTHQVRVVQHVESTARQARQFFERLANRAGGRIDAAADSVADACVTARAEVSKAAELARAGIAEAGGAACYAMDEANLRSLTATQGVVATTSEGVRALHEQVMVPVRALINKTATRIEGLGTKASQKITAEGEAKKSDYTTRSGQTDVETAQFERVGLLAPGVARTRAAEIVTEATARANSIRNGDIEAEISTVFLQMVEPTAVTTEEQGAADKQNQEQQAERVRHRTLTNEERAEKSISSAETLALEIITALEKQAVAALRRSAQDVRRSYRAQGAALEAGLKEAAPGYADIYRTMMRRVNASFPKGRFIDSRQFLPAIKDADKNLRLTAQQQRQAVKARAESSQRDAEEGADKQVASAWETAQTQKTQLSEQVGHQTNIIRLSEAAYRDGFAAGSQAVAELALEHEHDLEQKYGKAWKSTVRRQMRTVRNGLRGQFSATATAFRTTLGAKVREWKAEPNETDRKWGVFNPEVDPLPGEFRERADRLWAAFDQWGTDEEKAHKSLRNFRDAAGVEHAPLTKKGGLAVEEVYGTDDDGYSLRGQIDDEMSGDEEQAAYDYLDGKTAEGFVHEARSAISEAARLKDAARGLSDEDLARLEHVAGWEDTLAAMKVWLKPTDFDEIHALTVQHDRVRADAIALGSGIVTNSLGDRASPERIVELVREMGQTEMARRYPEGNAPRGELEAYRAQLLESWAGYVDEKHPRGWEPPGASTEGTAVERFESFATYNRFSPRGPQNDAQRRSDERYRLGESGRDAIHQLLVSGPNSAESRAAVLNFTSTKVLNLGMTEARRHELARAGQDPALVQAQRTLDELPATATDAERRSAQERVEQARVEHQKFTTAFAIRQGAPPEIQGDPAAMQEFAAQRMGDVMERDFRADVSTRRLFGESMMRDGRPNAAAAMRLAMEGTGTDKDLIKSTLRGMTSTEIEAMKVDYGDRWGNGDPTALDRRLGTHRTVRNVYGREVWARDNFGGEVSGDTANEVEILLLGEPRTDAEKARHAWMHELHQREGSGFISRSTLADTNVARNRQRAMGALESVILESARNGGPAFDIQGRPNPSAFAEDGQLRPTREPGPGGHPDPYDVNRRSRFEDARRWVISSTAAYQAAVDRQESFLLNIVMVIGVIVCLALAPFTGGATALLIAGLVAGIGTIIVKSGMRGDRYGWEEMTADVAGVVIDAVTMGAGGKIKMVGKAGLLVRGLVMGGIPAAARKAMQEETWKDGSGSAAGGIAWAGAKGTGAAMINEGVSARVTRSLQGAMRVRPGMNANTAMQRLGQAIGPNGTAALIGGLSNAAGAVTSEAATIGTEAMTGEFQGSWGDAFRRLGETGLRELAMGAASGRGDAIRTTRLTARRDGLRARYQESGGRLSDADMRALMRTEGRLAAHAGEDFNEAEVRRDLESRVARGPRDRLLSVFPDGQRAALDQLPLHALEQLSGLLQAGHGGRPGTRTHLLDLVHKYAPDLDTRTLDRAIRDADAEVARRVVETEGHAREVRKALGRVVPPEVARALSGADLSALRGLGPEGLARLKAMVHEGTGGTPHDRAALLAEVRRSRPDADVRAFHRALEQVLTTGTRIRDQARQTARETRVSVLRELPVGMRRSAARLPEDALATLGRMIQRGEPASAADRAALGRAARAADPNVDVRAFLAAVDRVVAGVQTHRAQERRAARTERMRTLSDLPARIAGPLSALPDAALVQVRFILARGTPPSAHERASLLRALHAESPHVAPETLARALDEAVARGRPPIDAATEKAHRAELISGIPSGLRAKVADTPLLVLGAEAFRRFTGSDKARAVTILIHGRPHVVLKEGAPPHVLREEGLHVLQTKEPGWRRDAARLDERRLADWKNLPLDEQLALYRTKIGLEIDAQHRLVEGLRADLDAAAPGSGHLHAQLAEAKSSLANLSRRAREVDAFTPDRAAHVRAGHEGRPSFLDQAPRLFAKHDGPAPVDPAARHASAQRVANALLEPGNPLRNDLLSGRPEAIRRILLEAGHWQTLMGAIDRAGPGHRHVGAALMKFREGVVAELGERFGARPVSSASRKFVSDVDLSTRGVHAGRDLQAAEAHMAERFGPDWSSALRMNFYTEATRLTRYGDRIERLAPDERADVQREISVASDRFNAARQVRYADSPAAREQILRRFEHVDQRLILELAEMSPAESLARRNELLNEIDGHSAAYAALPDGPARQRLAKAITLLQTEANLHTVEAYIGPGAGRMTVDGVPVRGYAAYDAAVSNLSELQHILHEAGGDPLKALREYEAYKYIYRFAKAAEGAGQNNAMRSYLEGIGHHVYNYDRNAFRVGDAKARRAPTDAELLEVWARFNEYVDAALPAMRAHTRANGGEWAPSVGVTRRGINKLKEWATRILGQRLHPHFRPGRDAFPRPPAPDLGAAPKARAPSVLDIIEQKTGIRRSPGDAADSRALAAHLAQLERGGLRADIDEATGVTRTPVREAEYALLLDHMRTLEAEGNHPVAERLAKMFGLDAGAQQARSEMSAYYQRMADAADANVVNVRGSSTDQLVDLTTGRRMVDATGKPWGYGIDYGFDVRFHASGVAQFTIKVHLDAQAGVHGADLARVRADATRGMDQFYNNPKHMVRGPDGRMLRLNVNVEFVSAPAGAHVSVKVHPGPGRADQTNWFVDSHGAVHAHELSHQLGLRDEYHENVPLQHNGGTYASGSRLNRFSPEVHTDRSLMGNFWTGPANAQVPHAQTRLQKRHIDQLMRQVYGQMGVRAPMRHWAIPRLSHPLRWLRTQFSITFMRVRARLRSATGRPATPMVPPGPLRPRGPLDFRAMAEGFRRLGDLSHIPGADRLEMSALIPRDRFGGRPLDAAGLATLGRLSGAQEHAEHMALLLHLHLHPDSVSPFLRVVGALDDATLDALAGSGRLRQLAAAPTTLAARVPPRAMLDVVDTVFGGSIARMEAFLAAHPHLKPADHAAALEALAKGVALPAVEAALTQLSRLRTNHPDIDLRLDGSEIVVNGQHRLSASQVHRVAELAADVRTMKTNGAREATARFDYADGVATRGDVGKAWETAYIRAYLDARAAGADAKAARRSAKGEADRAARTVATDRAVADARVRGQSEVDAGAAFSTAARARNAGTESAYNAGTHGSTARQLATGLHGLSVAQVQTRLDADAAGGRCTRVSTTLVGKGGISYPQHAYLYPDGSLVRVKPGGDGINGTHPMFSVEVIALGVTHPRNQDDVAFKLDRYGRPVPRGLDDAANPYSGQTNAEQANAWARTIIDAGHRATMEP